MWIFFSVNLKYSVDLSTYLCGKNAGPREAIEREEFNDWWMRLGSLVAISRGERSLFLFSEN